jgi:hypothetical protein
MRSVIMLGIGFCLGAIFIDLGEGRGGGSATRKRVFFVSVHRKCHYRQGYIIE